MVAQAQLINVGYIDLGCSFVGSDQRISWRFTRCMSWLLVALLRLTSWTPYAPARRRRYRLSLLMMTASSLAIFSSALSRSMPVTERSQLWDWLRWLSSLSGRGVESAPNWSR